VGFGTPGAGIQYLKAAAQPAGFVGAPVQQLAAYAARAVCFVADQIVDVQPSS
jgi:hypothetical protein